MTIPPTMRAAGVSSGGLVRTGNEDLASVDGAPVRSDTVATYDLAGARHLLLLADGMGGHARGEVASAVALESLHASAGALYDPEACIVAPPPVGVFLTLRM